MKSLIIVLIMTSLFACTCPEPKTASTQGASPMDSMESQTETGVLSNKEIISPSPAPEKSPLDGGVEPQNRPSR